VKDCEGEMGENMSVGGLVIVTVSMGDFDTQKKGGKAGQTNVRSGLSSWRTGIAMIVRTRKGCSGMSVTVPSQSAH